MSAFITLLFIFLFTPGGLAAAQSSSAQTGDQMAADFFHAEVGRIEEQSLRDVKTLQDWERLRPRLRRELAEMLGLFPTPEKTNLKATITGTLETEDFVVEKLHYQSMPGLYVTASLYRPQRVERPLPAILYLCGHARVEKEGVPYGNKVAYHHHPAWFARHGFVSMIIDTIQLGEIAGLHHGTNRENMWWWNARGYTPAGTETWNAIRALDYLETRPEVDSQRLGVTGRSGGGISAWWLAALDERIKVAVPVAGITDLRNYVVDGVIEGHCDCMFMVNTYRWDFPQVAALVAPRPLLLANSDKDRIFPLDGVLRLHRKLRKIYGLYEAEDRLGLLITEGPHRDTQDLRIPAFRWMNRWLKEDDALIEKPALKFFQPEELKVFAKLPEEKTSRIHESFVPRAEPPAVPRKMEEWTRLRNAWMRILNTKSFRGWPQAAGPLNLQEVLEVEGGDLRLTVYDFDSQPTVRLRLWLFVSSEGSPRQTVLSAVDQSQWRQWAGALAALFPNRLGKITGEQETTPNPEKLRELHRLVVEENRALALVAPRGIGPTAWSVDERKQVHLRRRFVLLGQTLDGMRIWDVRRAISTLSTIEALQDLPLSLRGQGPMAGILLYASLFEPVDRLELWELPSSHREGPVLLNVLKYFDIPQVLAMALTRTEVRLHESGREAWNWTQELVQNLGLGSKLNFNN